MPKKGYSPEQIIHKLREAEVLLSQGFAVGEVCRKIGVTDVTYYRWRSQRKWLKDHESELAGVFGR